MTTQLSSANVTLAPVIEACKRRVLLSHHGVASPVFTLGETFTIGDEIWKGLAVVTPDAIFMLKIERQSGFATPVAEASAGPTAICPAPVPGVFYSDLPAILTDDPNWPKPPVKQCQVAVLLRDRVRDVQPVPFSTEVAFTSEHPVVRIACAMDGKAATERLQRSGWIKPPPPGKPVKKERPLPRNPGPIVVGTSIVLLLVLSGAFIMVDSFPIPLALVLGIMVLGLGVWGAMRCIHPPQRDPDDDYDDET